MYRIYLIFLVLLSAAFTGNAQDSTIRTVVAEMPEFPGGKPKLYEFLSKQLKYPATAMAEGTEGRVVVRFVVDTSGQVVEPKVEQGVSDDLNREALRVIGKMPAWKPGRHEGRPVRVYYRLPVLFRLSSPPAKH